MRYRDILTETWQRQWRKTQTLPVGHKLFHGTNAVFEPEDDELMTPAWFSSAPSVAKHFARGGRVLPYEVVAPIKLPVITSRRERDLFFEKFGIEGDSAEDIADDMLRSGLPGWIIPNNYPDGDDILLVRLDNVQRLGETALQEARETVQTEGGYVVQINPNGPSIAKALANAPNGLRAIDIDGRNFAVADAFDVTHVDILYAVRDAGYDLSREKPGFYIVAPDRGHRAYRVTDKVRLAVRYGDENGDPAEDMDPSWWPVELQRAIRQPARESVRLSEERIVAYHGTGSKITQFHDGFLVPHYFTQDLNYARAYVGGKTDPRRRTRNYIVTVELTINRMFDTKTDEAARAYYNDKFVPFINPYRQRLGKPLAPVLAAGQWPSFTVADHLWGFMLEDEAPYDGMLIDEGGLTDAPAIVPFRASQIKVLKNQVVKL